MLVQFSIWPLDNPHMSANIAQVSEVLNQMGCRYEVGPMGTAIEGDWHEVMGAIQACHNVLRAAHARVLTTITINDDSTRALSINKATAVVTARREKVTHQIF